MRRPMTRAEMMQRMAMARQPQATGLGSLLNLLRMYPSQPGPVIPQPAIQPPMQPQIMPQPVMQPQTVMQPQVMPQVMPEMSQPVMQAQAPQRAAMINPAMNRQQFKKGGSVKKAPMPRGKSNMSALAKALKGK